MSGLSLGLEIKRLRNQTGIASKELSKKVGKAVTYVSQLERGLIKNPDYATSFNIMKELGVDIEKIEGILDYFGIISPQKYQLERELIIKELEEEYEEQSRNPEAFAQSKLDEFYGRQKASLNMNNERIHRVFKSMIDNDYSRAETVIENLSFLTMNRENFNFLCSFLEIDFSQTDKEDRQELIEIIDRFMKER